MFEKINKIHFVGIGGSGMCGIAGVLINMGYSISGSDICENDNTRRLRAMGATVYIGHSENNLKKPHVVVVSSAIDIDNCEIMYSLKNKIPVIPRAEMLAELMRLKYAVCIAGTHGKTTTTSMTGLILHQAGMDPTVIIGGRFNNLETNAKLGEGKYLVAEADESDGSFMYFNPVVSIVTNIDNDHMDYYRSMEKLKSTFIRFINKVPFYGFAVLCGDNMNLKSIIPYLKRPYVTYGLKSFNNYSAKDIKLMPERSEYTVLKGNDVIGRIVVNSSGMHNIINSLASCTAAMELGIPFPIVREALKKYKGVERRLEKVGQIKDIFFYDDYAHHPTEISLALKGLKKIYPDSRLIAVFQPHRYTRTRDLYMDFPNSLQVADLVYITEIYSAGEKPIKNVNSQMIINEFTERDKLRYCTDLNCVTEELVSELKPGDVLLTLGAGNVCEVGKSLLTRLSDKNI